MREQPIWWKKMIEEKPDFTIQQLAAIREAILTVIDDGPYKCGASKDEKDDIWEFYRGGFLGEVSEDDANAARLDFCDSIQEKLMKWIKEAA